MIKNMALLLVVLGIVPFLLGLFYTGFIEKEKNNILLHMAAGYVIMFGLFELRPCRSFFCVSRCLCWCISMEGFYLQYLPFHCFVISDGYR